jgi:hypothetical protein
MWANYYSQNFLPALNQSKKSAIQHCAPSVEHRAVPVAVIPLDDVDALIEKAVASYQEDRFATFEGAMRAALAAIGVLPKSKGGRK